MIAGFQKTHPFILYLLSGSPAAWNWCSRHVSHIPEKKGQRAKWEDGAPRERNTGAVKTHKVTWCSELQPAREEKGETLKWVGTWTKA